MRIEIETEITIQRPRSVVADYASDPTNFPAWQVDFEGTVEWLTPPPLKAGSRFALVLPGKPPADNPTFDVLNFIEHEQLTFGGSSLWGGFRQTLTWRDTGDGDTRMKLQLIGEGDLLVNLSAQSAKTMAPLVASFISDTFLDTSNEALARIKAVLEPPRVSDLSKRGTQSGRSRQRRRR